MKKYIALLLTLILTLALCACALADEPIVLKLASTQSPEMNAIKCLNAFAKDVEEKTGGKVIVQVYPASQLGDQRDYLEGITMGTVEMCLIATSAIESYDEHFALFGVPGLFKSSEHIHAFYDKPECQEIFETFRNDYGVMTVGLYDEGIRNVWLSEKPAASLEDFQGIKLRVPEVAVYVSMFKALGFNTTPMAWSECYTGLQTGVIEGVENNVEMVTSSNLTDVIKYQVKTEHIYSTLLLLLNEDVYNRMDPETQKIFMQCVEDCNNNTLASFTAGQEAAYAKAEAAGVQTIQIPEDKKAAVDEALMGVTRETLTGLFDDSIYDVIANVEY